MWFSLLHHVIDEHEWGLSYTFPDSYKCDHGALEDNTEKEWLEQDGPAHNALRKLIMEPRLLNKIPYFLNFRTTAELENFQQQILTYAAKRFAYSPPVYEARTLLAALDHNFNAERPLLVNKDGKIRYKRLFNKKSSRLTVVAQQVSKSYQHINGLLRNILETRLQDTVNLRAKRVLEAWDPRKISRSIAVVSPPPTQQLVEKKKSRLT